MSSIQPLLVELVDAGVKRAAEAAGLDPASYAGHSLRAGFATQAFLKWPPRYRLCGGPAISPSILSASTFVTARCSGTTRLPGLDFDQALAYGMRGKPVRCDDLLADGEVSNTYGPETWDSLRARPTSLLRTT
jgi:hypothetical protein